MKKKNNKIFIFLANIIALSYNNLKKWIENPIIEKLIILKIFFKRIHYCMHSTGSHYHTTDYQLNKMFKLIINDSGLPENTENNIDNISVTNKKRKRSVNK